MNDTPRDPRVPGQLPHDPDNQADPDDDDVDELVYDLTGKRRFLNGRRLVGVAIAAAVLIGAGAAFALAGGEEGDGSESATGDDGGSEEAFADAAYEYAGCMRENGLDAWPDPVVDEDGGIDMDPGGGEAYDLDDPDVEAANEECQSILDGAEPAGSDPGLTPEEQAEMQDQVLAMAQCMRDRGWDFPDPEVDADGGHVGIVVGDGSTLPQEGDPDFDQFEQDQEQCTEQAGMPTEGEDEDGGEG